MFIHLDEKGFECIRCLNQYATRAVLLNHAKKIHPHQVDAIVKRKSATEQDKEVKAMIEKWESGWKCIICERTAKYKFKIGVHVSQVHLKMRPFACTECNKSYSTTCKRAF